MERRKSQSESSSSESSLVIELPWKTTAVSLQFVPEEKGFFSDEPEAVELFLGQSGIPISELEHFFMKLNAKISGNSAIHPRDVATHLDSKAVLLLKISLGLMLLFIVFTVIDVGYLNEPVLTYLAGGFLVSAVALQMLIMAFNAEFRRKNLKGKCLSKEELNRLRSEIIVYLGNSNFLKDYRVNAAVGNEGQLITLKSAVRN